MGVAMQKMSHALLDRSVDHLRQAASGRGIACKVCGGATDAFDIVDFNKSCCSEKYPLGLASIPVMYRICNSCQFIFTDFFDDFSAEEWKLHVYNDDYVKVDPEYVDIRPRMTAKQLEAFLVGRKNSTIGLDYGGGNGMTTALLREDGWSFDCYDPFGHTDFTPERKGNYNFCCAMEVFEHTTDPIGSLRNIVEMARSGPLVIMIGTGIHDGIVSKEMRLNWWYAAPRNGHVSLYSRQSLRALGARFGLTYAGIFSGPHLLLRGIGEREARARLLAGKVLRRCRSAMRM